VAERDSARAAGPSGRIVVRAPNWIGDAILSLAALRDLRRNFPAARLEVLARGWVAELYDAVAEVDGVRASRGLRADAAALRGGFDVAVLLPNSIASALPPLLARVPERWGYATAGRGPLLTRAGRVPAAIRGRSQVYYYRAMLAAVGLRVSAAPDVSLRCPDAWRARGGALLAGGDADGGPWIGLNPGAFFGGAKRWIPARFAAVGDLVARRFGARVVLVGGADERPLALAIAAQMQARARVLTGETTLAGLAGVLAHLRLLVTNDSGPMHLAAALGVPVVGLFGPTDWTETAPWGERHRLVRAQAECAPCKLRECPIDHRCMARLSVERVAREIDALMEEDE
jgi:heptosyltransferase-2